MGGGASASRARNRARAIVWPGQSKPRRGNADGAEGTQLHQALRQREVLPRKEGGCQNWARVGGESRQRKEHVERSQIVSRRQERWREGAHLLWRYAP